LSRIGAAVGTYLVPVSLSHLGTGATMIVGAVVTFVGAGVSILWAPETRGLTLGESCAVNSTSPTAVSRAA
jgi:putative MFS transporter